MCVNVSDLKWMVILVKLMKQVLFAGTLSR